MRNHFGFFNDSDMNRKIFFGFGKSYKIVHEKLAATLKKV